MSAGKVVYGRIYKNGEAYGTERSMSSITPETFSEDLAFVARDLIQLYMKNVDAGYGYNLSSPGLAVKGTPTPVDPRIIDLANLIDYFTIILD